MWIGDLFARHGQFEGEVVRAELAGANSREPAGGMLGGGQHLPGASPVLGPVPQRFETLQHNQPIELSTRHRRGDQAQPQHRPRQPQSAGQGGGPRSLAGPLRFPPRHPHREGGHGQAGQPRRSAFRQQQAERNRHHRQHPPPAHAGRAGLANGGSLPGGGGWLRPRGGPERFGCWPEPPGQAGQQRCGEGVGQCEEPHRFLAVLQPRFPQHLAGGVERNSEFKIDRFQPTDVIAGPQAGGWVGGVGQSLLSGDQFGLEIAVVGTGLLIAHQVLPDPQQGQGEDQAGNQSLQASHPGCFGLQRSQAAPGGPQPAPLGDQRGSRPQIGGGGGHQEREQGGTAEQGDEGIDQLPAGRGGSVPGPPRGQHRQGQGTEHSETKRSTCRGGFGRRQQSAGTGSRQQDCSQQGPPPTQVGGACGK